MSGNEEDETLGRGFLGGIIWGTLVSLVVAAAASLVVGAGKGAAPRATSLEVPAGSEFNQSRNDEQAVLPAPEATPEAGAASRVTAPVPDSLATMANTDIESASQPVAGLGGSAMTAPVAAGDAGVSVQADAPVLPNPQAMAPVEPGGEAELSISTDPAQPQPPAVDAGASAFPADEIAAVAEPAGAEAEPGETVTEPVTETVTEPVTEVEAAPEVEAVAIAPSPEPLAPVATAPELTETETRPAIGQPVGALPNLAPNVAINRLPSLAPQAEEVVQETAEIMLDKGAMPPLEQYAEVFENLEQKPLMSIVLIDDGSSPIGVDALASFPYPLSFAVDVAWEGATEAMQRYRDKGFEVLALVDLPQGATASDTEVAMETYMARLPEAVAIMEGEATGVQGSRDALDQMNSILSASGHGLLLFSKGLDTAQKLAVKAGVPATTVFRDFDSKGQEPVVIRRFLDQAAFKAGQQAGGVVMVGRLRPDTVTALILWGLQDRATRVALAPISAVLQLHKK